MRRVNTGVSNISTPDYTPLAYSTQEGMNGKTQMSQQEWQHGTGKSSPHDNSDERKSYCSFVAKDFPSHGSCKGTVWLIAWKAFVSSLAAVRHALVLSGEFEVS